jgi:hypothetical protein
VPTMQPESRSALLPEQPSIPEMKRRRADETQDSYNR